ncbi:histidine kinase [Microbacterium sp. 10M-3C3]|jgi:signal transduction histidine kinase|uniref:sensor histidine kinase n=1 Tax=Microbacterium sp. 10M-3C3 TaxID=2483401 RepID=UPI000F62F41D|nr:histidine kinase [Microbacterium sp. 10M-3C3]
MFRALRPFQIVTDLVLAGLFALVVLPIEYSTGGFTATAAVGALAGAIVLTAALAVRRWSPGLALALAWLAAIVQMATQNQPRVSDVAIFAVLYVTAAYGSRWVYWLGLASAIVGAVVVTVYIFLGFTDVSWASLPLAFAVLVAATFALGLSWVTGALVRAAVRGAQARRERAVAEAEAAIEQERVRIARDMHDVVAHSLAVVIAQADGARYAAASDPDAAAEALATISTTARAALGDVRLLLTQLRHSEGAGPQPQLADVEGLYAQVRAAGVGLHVEVDPMPRAEPSAAVQLAVYRILQEALTNALRHGTVREDAGGVAVRLAWHEDRVELDVSNPFSPASAPAAPAPGHGLIGMRERAQLAGGTLWAGPEGTTWHVRSTLPLATTPEFAGPGASRDRTGEERA